jgi:serine/threonine protein kinase/Tol biopolymer transport system component
MKAERWKQIDSILQAALDRAPAERSAFLEQACVGDPSLRPEVEALIDSHEKAGSFIEAPVFEAAAELVVDSATESLIGQSLGPYKISAELGAGGMGVVYLAFDTRLGRRVALKLLPAHFTRDQQRLRRFHQEARAASALNHPNIVTIFEIGRAGDRPFIATEYIEGETLRRRLSTAKIGVLEALDVALQVAGALGAAHDAGIIHRDIKPENVMVRPDGYIKVLDFGLAKLTEALDSGGTQAPTIAQINTEAGVVMGTVVYMSPEQARGEKVDARTDLFSLGAVLYEMIAGRQPFEGKSSGDVIASILHKEPAPLARFSREAPEALEWIVAKALIKDCGERYQTAKDMIVDLRRLKQRLEFEAEHERSTTSAPSETVVLQTAGGPVTATKDEPATQTGNVGMVRTTSSAEYLISEIKRHKLTITASLAILAILIAAGIYWALTLNTQSKTTPRFETMKMTRLTSTGKASEAAISPDGKYVAYVMNEAAGQSIWIRHVATSSNVQIAPTAEASYGDVTFSPDGNYVYYATQGSREPANSLYQVPVLGGAPKKITERVHGGIAFSPDGKQIVFARWKPGRGEGPRSEKLLIVMNVDGTGERTLTSRWTPEVIYDSAWSPDGRVIAFTVFDLSDNNFSIVGVRAADGTEKPIVSKKWFNVGRIAWLADGSGLLVPGSDKPSGLPQIWHLAYPTGEWRRITNDLNGYGDVSLSADSKTLITVQSDQVSNIWIAHAGDDARAKQVTSGAGRYGAGDFAKSANGAGFIDRGGGVCWTPDGRIAYHSLASGRLDLWIMNADGTGRRQLTSDSGSNIHPSPSPDGRYIVFESDRGGKDDVWRMDLDGNNAKQLTQSGSWSSSCSGDGKWVIFQGESSGNHVVMKLPIEGGAPIQVSSEKDVAERPSASPDGNLIACNFVPPGSDWQMRIAALSIESGKPAHVFDILSINPFREIRWTGDGRYLTYIDTHEGVSNLWGQPLDGGKPVRLTSFTSDLIFSWDWSRDGKQLAVARGSVTSDVVLISDFR